MASRPAIPPGKFKTFEIRDYHDVQRALNVICEKDPKTGKLAQPMTCMFQLPVIKRQCEEHNSNNKCGEWYLKAIEEYCKKDKTLHPCGELQFHIGRPTKPDKRLPKLIVTSATIPTTTTTAPDTTTHDCPPSPFLYGAIGLCLLLFILLIVVVFAWHKDTKKSFFPKSKNPKNKKTTGKSSTESTSGKSKKSEKASPV